jgi:hypothetical protein
MKYDIFSTPPSTGVCTSQSVLSARPVSRWETSAGVTTRIVATLPAPETTPCCVKLMPVRFLDQSAEHGVAQVRPEREPLVAGHEEARGRDLEAAHVQCLQPGASPAAAYRLRHGDRPGRHVAA